MPPVTWAIPRFRHRIGRRAWSPGSKSVGGVGAEAPVLATSQVNVLVLVDAVALLKGGLPAGGAKEPTEPP